MICKLNAKISLLYSAIFIFMFCFVKNRPDPPGFCGPLFNWARFILKQWEYEYLNLVCRVNNDA